MRNLCSLLCALLFGATCALAAPTVAAASDPSAVLGVYVGPNSPSKVAAYEQWRGRPVAKVLDYLADDDWSMIATPTWWTSGWSASAYRDRLVYSVPMLPRSTGTMQEGARGDYNGNFVSLARTLVAAGQGSVVIRPGWEMNGSWYRWSAAPDPQAYIDYFRHIVTAMRSVSGAAFTFEWSPNAGPSAMPADQAYPGDAYVDTIGLDIYDQYWGTNPSDPEVRWNSYVSQPYGLAWHRDFARLHGKPMTFPEWGLALRNDGYGGGDNPSFIQHMYDWIAANDVAFANYFEYDSPYTRASLMSGQFPSSAALFLQLFGASDPPPPAPDTTAPTTTVACNGTTCSRNAYSATVTITLSASDAGSGVAETRYTLDGSTPTRTHGTRYAGAFTLSKSANVRFCSFDAAGNAETPRTQKVRVR